MRLVRFIVALGVLSLAKTCSAGIILTLTPTSRVDTETQTRITYTFSAAADSGTQNVSEYFFRLNVASLPVLSNRTDYFFNITKAADNTVWGASAAGPFTQTSVSPSPNAIRYQTLTVTGANKTIDSLGGVVGSFDILWNRPQTGQYDAAIGTDYFSGAYNVADSGGSTQFAVIKSLGAGISTLVVAAPEPGTMPLMVLSSFGFLAWRRRRVELL